TRVRTRALPCCLASQSRVLKTRSASVPNILRISLSIRKAEEKGCKLPLFRKRPGRHGADFNRRAVKQSREIGRKRQRVTGDRLRRKDEASLPRGVHENR